MFKKIFWALSFILIFATISIVLCREIIFPTSINFGFGKDYQDASCKAWVEKDGKIHLLNKPCGYLFKFRASYGSKVKISIDSPSGVIIKYSRIGHTYPEAKQFKDYFKTLSGNVKVSKDDIELTSKHTILEIIGPIPAQCKQVSIIFKHPYWLICLSFIAYPIALLFVFYLFKFLFFIFTKAKNIRIRVNFTEKSLIRSLKILSFGLLALLICFQIFRTIYPSLEYDSSYNATISKNLAFGYGYASSYDSIKLFNPEVTTGPTLLFPTALGIKIFSNKYWVPNLVYSVITLALLLITFYLPKKFDFVDEKRLWIWRTLFLAFIILLSSVGTPLEYYNYEFANLLGEIPAALLVVLSSFILIIAKKKKVLYYSAGLIAGLAINTKFLTLMSVLGISSAYFMFNQESKNSFKSNILHIILFFSGMLTPSLIFEIYKFSSVKTLSNYLDLKNYEYSFFSYAGSGIVSDKNIFNRFIFNLTKSINIFGLARVLTLIFVPLIFIFNFIRKKIENNTASLLTFIMMCASFINVTWWLFMSKGWTRHLYFGRMLFLIALSTFIFALKKEQKLVYSLIVLLFLTLPCSMNVEKFFLKFKSLQKSSLQEQTKVINFIETHKQYKYFGCGWWGNRDLEYALPTVNNFSDCLNSKNFNDNVSNKALVITKAYWHTDNNSQVIQIQQECEKHIIFENNAYVISNCDAK